MIHYTSTNTEKIFRSLTNARRAGGEIHAYASKKDALCGGYGIHLTRHCPTPAELTAQDLENFATDHAEALSNHPKHPPRNASGRRRLEAKYNVRLFGFHAGRAIDAEQCMSVSARWIRYSCPVYVDGRKRTINAL